MLFRKANHIAHPEPALTTLRPVVLQPTPIRIPTHRRRANPQQPAHFLQRKLRIQNPADQLRPALLKIALVVVRRHFVRKERPQKLDQLRHVSQISLQILVQNRLNRSRILRPPRTRAVKLVFRKRTSPSPISAFERRALRPLPPLVSRNALSMYEIGSMVFVVDMFATGDYTRRTPGAMSIESPKLRNRYRSATASE